MTNAYYEDAHKRAVKEYRRCVTKGLYPYLPVLDHVVSPERAAAGNEIGLVNVPADLIVGTKTVGRSRSFAANFMPLMKSDSELATKWCNLCQAHLDEGIRDAVKVYEYLNRYYVEEGNKRVSVMKFFGAVTIPAIVIRIMPVMKEDEAALLYFEMLDFQKVTGINFIEFSKKGRYEELLGLLGRTKLEKWTEEEQRAFSSVYYYFKETYMKSIGKRFETTPGDAMLAYIKVFGYDSLKAAGAHEIKKNLVKMAEDLILMKEPEPVQLNLEPEKLGSNLINQMKNLTVPIVPISKKIAFVHEKNVEDSGWTNNHEAGRLMVQENFGNKIKTTSYFDAKGHGDLETIEQAIADGNQVIFTTSPRLYQASLKAAVEHPKVIILNCSLNKSHRYVRSYYGRIYEAKFIAGAIAATMSDSGRLGYICTYPIYGQIAGINAFALGAQMVNPDAKVYLEWSEVNELKATVQKLVARDVHYISSVETMPKHEEHYKYFGLMRATKEEIVSLGIPVWNWGIYYDDIIQQILDGTYQQVEGESSKAVNYYWGMSAGVVDIECSDHMPASSKKLVSFLRESIRFGNSNPFMGPIYNQKGEEVVPGGLSMSIEEIVNMDYLVENVIGQMPAFDDLSPGVQATTVVMGVDKVAKQAIDPEATSE